MWLLAYKDYGEPSIVMGYELWAEKPTDEELKNRWRALWGFDDELEMKHDGVRPGDVSVYTHDGRIVECDHLQLSSSTKTTEYLKDALNRRLKDREVPFWAAALLSNPAVDEG